MELKAKAAMASAAEMLASSYQLVLHNSHSFIPVHWLTRDFEPTPAPEETIWIPLSRDDKRRLANRKAKILFPSDGELRSFDFMLTQFSEEELHTPDGMLVPTEDGLKTLNSKGELVDPTGRFTPNSVAVPLNNDPIIKGEVWNTIVEWLNSEEAAHSLLHHLATALAPSWSAVKYVLLLGDGRNGKSTLLSMLSDLFGKENVSNITRQQMSEQLPVCVELNNKLLNIVFDGRMDYIKDSGLEKTLIAGEPGFIRMLYESGTTRVQTNALFIEGLNREPKTRDKSSALQKRMVRFWFPNVYDRDIRFEAKMRSPEYLGALLSLMIDHYVTKDEVIEKLAPSSQALELQVNQMWANSPVLQYLEVLLLKTPAEADKLVGAELDPYVNSFMAWRLDEGFSEYSSADAVNMFRECFDIKWHTVRVNGKPSRQRRIAGLKTDTQLFIDQLRKDGADGSDNEGAVVDDGLLHDDDDLS